MAQINSHQNRPGRNFNIENPCNKSLQNDILQPSVSFMSQKHLNTKVHVLINDTHDIFSFFRKMSYFDLLASRKTFGDKLVILPDFVLLSRSQFFFFQLKLDPIWN